MSERMIDRPGLNTPGEDTAWNALRERVVISLRPIGAPTSIGFLGLAAASLTLTGLQLGWVPEAEGKHLALVLIGFVFLAQLLAAIFSFLARDGTAATAMATLALTWLVVGLVLYTSAPGATSPALGLFLLFAGTAMALSGLTAALSKLVPAVVFLLASIRFFLTGGYHLTGGTGWKVAGGYVGVLLVVVAVYAAGAAGLEDATGRA